MYIYYCSNVLIWLIRKLFLFFFIGPHHLEKATNNVKIFRLLYFHFFQIIILTFCINDIDFSNINEIKVRLCQRLLWAPSPTSCALNPEKHWGFQHRLVVLACSAFDWVAAWKQIPHCAHDPSAEMWISAIWLKVDPMGSSSSQTSGPAGPHRRQTPHVRDQKHVPSQVS